MTTSIRQMRETDVVESARIFRLAFGTFLGMPDPAIFAAGREYIATRFRTDPLASLVSESDGRITGSNIVTTWGSFGFFGPLTVLPELWDKGVARALLGPTMDLFDQRGVRQAGLFTFLQSPKHVALYQKFGFWPGFLIGVASKPVTQAGHWTRYAPSAASDCRALTDSIFEGLDLSHEIRAVEEQGLGETVLVWEGDSLGGFAVCHCGDGTEAGPDNCYIKFAVARGRTEFQQLLNACEAMAQKRGLARIETGVNFERIEAYQELLRHGYRVERQALAMHRNGLRAYNRRDVYALDDWR